MSQTPDLSPDNGSGLEVRIAINQCLAALFSLSSGGSAPTATVPYMLWLDTSAAVDVLKMRNAADNGWITLGSLDEVSGLFALNGQTSGRNLIINGSGRVNQRDYVSGTSMPGPNTYALDRWRVVVSGQSLTYTGDDAGRTMTAPAGGAEQVIEGACVVGGTYVVNWTGTATCTVNGVPRTKGETFSLPKNTDAVIRLSGGTFSSVQVERGIAPTPFEHLSYSEELVRCQRYYWRGLPVGSYNFPSYAVGSVATLVVKWPVTMRVTPALNQNLAGAVYVSASFFAFNEATRNGARFLLESTAINVNANVSFGASSYLEADAEF